MYKYAGIIVNNEALQVDKIYTYKIPTSLTDAIQIGHRVKVPFGLGNKKIDGFVVKLYENMENTYNIKEIYDICDKFTVLEPKDIKLMDIMREKYLCSYLDCIRTLIPAGITKGMKNKVSEVIFINNELPDKFKKEPYTNIYNIVKDNNGVYNRNELNKYFSLSQSSIITMLKHGILSQNQKIVDRFNVREYREYKEKNLNDEQRNVVSQIVGGSENYFLIHGVTGSGKTEVYMNLVSRMLKENKDSIILVPEIALTPQMVERFKGRFGKDISVFHSKLSEGERYDEWLRVKLGKVKVAIGARSAIFLPFNNLGLIVIDEEHEASYKSESNPKYNAKEIARIRCELENCKLILGSATPSVETYYDTDKGDIKLLTINHRADGALMPKVEIVDMRKELLNNNKSIFSSKLYQSIKDCISRKEQVILFLNRRGFSTFVSCRQCGYVFKCDSCDISMTYHFENGMLRCHYCGKSKRVHGKCPKCQSKYVKYFGIGTEKVEEEIKIHFPTAKVLRMDFDTTRRKNSHESIYNDFKEGNADVLIGTQMVAKGLDFKNVTLVGVLAADLSLNLPDFRAAERTFQLITQVSGRAGRGEKPGNVVIQTYNPENYSILYSAVNNYSDFYKEEINLRESMNYPPFSKILAINFSSKDENLLIKRIQSIGVELKNKLDSNTKVEMLGPCPCEISKIKDLYRWQIIFKGDINYDFAKKTKDDIYEALRECYNDIRVSLDINPNSLL